MKKREHRQYRGKGNRHNRFKRDTNKLSRYEREGKPAGWLGFRWNDETK